MVKTDTTMIDRLKQFVESEMRSCSMDIGGITPLYVLDETVKEFKRRFTNKKFCLIVCDWELGSPQKDGVELLKRLGNTCHIKETDRLMYSGKLDIKLHDKLTEYKEHKITDDALIGYIKGLVVARFIDFVDRNDLEKQYCSTCRRWRLLTTSCLRL